MIKKSESEHETHAAIWRFMEIIGIVEEYAVFHVPNGGMRSKAEAGKIKSLGVRAGVPDIIFLDIPLCIEIKRENGYLSIEQKKFRDKIIAHGGYYAIARSLGEFIQILALHNIVEPGKPGISVGSYEPLCVVKFERRKK